jgi:hypothetical protein
LILPLIIKILMTCFLCEVPITPFEEELNKMTYCC